MFVREKSATQMKLSPPSMGKLKVLVDARFKSHTFVGVVLTGLTVLIIVCTRCFVPAITRQCDLYMCTYT